MKMVQPMSNDLKRDVASLKGDSRFIAYLAWLAESREIAHQRTYTVLEQPQVNFLQGAAKTIFDVVNETHEAFAFTPGQAIPGADEHPFGDI
jgi:hypothetical protein